MRDPVCNMQVDLDSRLRIQGRTFYSCSAQCKGEFVRIEAAGFQITELKTFYLPGPHPMTYTYQGLARIVVNFR